MSLFKRNPLHAAIYLVTRTGNALGDTACATLVARASAGSEVRARNLGAIYSVRAGARIVTPLLSAWLFEISRRGVVRGGGIGGNRNHIRDTRLLDWLIGGLVGSWNSGY